MCKLFCPVLTHIFTFFAVFIRIFVPLWFQTSRTLLEITVILIRIKQDTFNVSMGSNLSVNKLIVLYVQNLSYFTGAWTLL